MNSSPISLPANEGNQRNSVTPALPCWEHLTAAHQHEMVLTLATILTRRLPLPKRLPTHPEQQEVRYESTS